MRQLQLHGTLPLFLGWIPSSQVAGSVEFVFDHGQEYGCGEGLLHKRISFRGVAWVAAGVGVAGHENEPNLEIARHEPVQQLDQQLRAAHLRHADIDQSQMDRLLQSPYDFKRLVSIFGHKNFISRLGQYRNAIIANILLVIDDQNRLRATEAWVHYWVSVRSGHVQPPDNWPPDPIPLLRRSFRKTASEDMIHK